MPLEAARIKVFGYLMRSLIVVSIIIVDLVVVIIPPLGARLADVR
ncbi:hypothetical protein GCM10027295_34230 [Pseudaeromonas pectinilytica]